MILPYWEALETLFKGKQVPDVVHFTPNTPHHMPVPQMVDCLSAWDKAGAHLINLVGENDPLEYRYIQYLCLAMASSNMGLSIETAGLVLDDRIADLFAETQWFKVTILNNGNCPETYTIMHNECERAWFRSYEALRLFQVCKDPLRTDQVVGVRYEAFNQNYDNVYAACVQAKAKGADFFEVRYSDELEPRNYSKAHSQCKCAQRELGEETFKVSCALLEQLDHSCLVSGDGQLQINTI